jgi:tryptophanyl-tRNA synthetase
MNKRILSGVKPTGKPHLGNYFGAMRQFVDLQNQNEGENFFMIANYHALNFIQNGEELRELTDSLIIDFLAIGLDPKKSNIFKQSDVSEHTELAWIFDSITTVPYLKRAHAYKDALAKGGEESVSAGTFTYPMLMASDILLYSPDIVPVGQDQKQHIEFARDTAEKFNRIFSETFKMPEDYILPNVETVPGIDGKKMSKSYGNTIGLFASDEEIEEKVMAIVTDSSGEVPTNVYAIHRLIRNEEEINNIYEDNKGKYKILKEILIEDLKNFIKPLRERRKEIESNKDYISETLKTGTERARAVASSKLVEAKGAIGV